ncbi:transglycosylase SLT domain-containing protein [Streptomyces sp. NPDC026092]|uniref:transglycosylase SLT domain-containing protein n=1 Tax=Streptomyces sp. NPDC026092 TaxID=3154797 RepID=UPI0033D34DA0
MKPFSTRSTTVRNRLTRKIATLGLVAAGAVTAVAVPGTAHAEAQAPVRPAAQVPSAVGLSGGLDSWIAQARAILAAHGDKVPSAAAIKARALTESSGNPRAENHWDANQAQYGGTYGLLQTIRPTFAAYALPGHTNILNPVDSIISGVRYANARYGSFETIAHTKAGY